MNAGIERDQILWIMREMIQHLERADESLHVSMVEYRKSLFIEQSERVAEFADYLEMLENGGQGSLLITPTRNDQDEYQALKFELGY